MSSSTPKEVETSTTICHLPPSIETCLLTQCLCNKYELVSVHEAKSAQHSVWVIHLQPTTRRCDKTKQQQPKISQPFFTALSRGNNCVVVREWHGGCQWWNLNRNGSATELARKEVMAYRLARQHLAEVIPQVLWFCEEEGSHHPWAVLEYIGPHCRRFEENPCTNYFQENMIHTRLEFGFEEPHPRWGRVPIEESLGYAKLLIDRVILPLHQSWVAPCQERSSVPLATLTDGPPEEFTYQTMITDKCVPVLAEIKSKMPEQPDERWSRVLSVIQFAIEQVLPRNLLSLSHLPSVLVHLDLQPQNLLFKQLASAVPKEGTVDAENCKVVAIFDWEDAAVADLRFELLLVARKVCANREQANAIWTYYNERRVEGCDDLGSIVPWLQLETTHSLCSLLLQSLDLLNGGRNPWETKTDLWCKIQRELLRWEGLCRENLS